MNINYFKDSDDKSNNHKISIGLPVYNGEAFIDLTLDSILSQSFEDFELIISDNASTDTTEKICREYAAKDKRVKYIRQKENLGGVYNFKKQLHKDSRILTIMYGNSMEEKKIQTVKVSFPYYFLLLGLKFYHFLPSKPIQIFFLKMGSQYGRVM